MKCIIPGHGTSRDLAEQAAMMRHKLQNLCVHHLKAVGAGLHKLFSYDLWNKQYVTQPAKSNQVCRQLVHST